MPITTPNKEIVRRICHLHGATKCHLLVQPNNDFVEVLTNIENGKIETCILELKEWAGMTFKVYNFSDKKAVIRILEQGETIFPIKL